MAVSFSVSFNDPNANYSEYYSLLRSNALAAAERWGSHFLGNASIEIKIGFTDVNGSGRGGGGPGFNQYIGTQGGRNVYEPGDAYEIRTGTDPNGSGPDIRVNLVPDYLINELWLDPTPNDRTTAGPSDRTDAVSV